MFGYTVETFGKDRAIVETFETLSLAVAETEQIGKPIGSRLEAHLNRHLAVKGISVSMFSGKDKSTVIVSENGVNTVLVLPSHWEYETAKEVSGYNGAKTRVEAWKRWNSDDAKEDREMVESLQKEVEVTQQILDQIYSRLAGIQTKYA